MVRCSNSGLRGRVIKQTTGLGLGKLGAGLSIVKKEDCRLVPSYDKSQDNQI